MARSYSRKDFPHRVLFDVGANAQRGDDVKVLQRHTDRRLDARDIDRDIKVDGVFGKRTMAAAKTAAHFLGVPSDWTDSKALLVREQRVIIYPSSRTASMLDSADARMDALLKERRDRDRGDLGERDRVKARQIAVAAFRLAWRHRGIVHYTQGASRWQGIREGRRYGSDRFPTYADCSSLATWCLWNALTNARGMATPDVVNGCGWTAGYTGTMLCHGRRVDSRLPGDLVIYGRRFPGAHVAMVADNTDMVYSHGSESGPHYLPWRYRSDVMSVRRYIL